MTVPPRASLICLKCERSARTHSNRRCEPSATLSGTFGAGFANAQPSSPSPSAAPRARATSVRGLVTACSARRAARSGKVIRSSTPRATIVLVDGSGSGTQPSSSSRGFGTGWRSKSTVRMSTPETPSTSAWWVFVRSAKRLRVRPWTSQSSQSGFERSSRWNKMPRRHPPQLFLGARGRQGRMADVVLEVEGRVVGPERPPGLRGRVGELLPEPRDEVKPRADVLGRSS